MSDTNVEALVYGPQGQTLFYKLRGYGPLLAILQGGAGDADGCEATVKLLAEHFRVLTYDRRGLSRSSAEPLTDLRQHAADLALLLAQLAAEPAYVLGVSVGAMIGLDLLARYPQLVRTLIAFEPPAAELLPEAQRAHAEALHQSVARTFAEQGPRAAMLEFLRGLGGDFGDFEPGFEVPAPSPFLGPNYECLLRQDMPALHGYRLDLEALNAHKQRLIAAVGARSVDNLLAGGSGAVLKVGPALRLSARLDVPLRIFPGGHGGYATYPRAFSAQLRALLLSHAEPQV
jgi:pimeloyl-ACP methyl ester carboxylesterase